MMPRTRGFTLVELLVAIAVMALLALLSWRAIDGMGRIESATRQRSDALLGLQAALGQWGADLDALIETAQVPAIDFDGRTLRLTRRDPLDSDSASTGVQVVAWAQHGTQWMRWQTGGLQTRDGLRQAWDAAARWGQRPLAQDAAREVAMVPTTRWQVFYYRGNAWTHPLSSDGLSPPATAGTPGNADAGALQALAAARRLAALPDGVRLVLELAPGQPFGGELVRDWARPVLGGGKS